MSAPGSTGNVIAALARLGHWHILNQARLEMAKSEVSPKIKSIAGAKKRLGRLGAFAICLALVFGGIACGDSERQQRDAAIAARNMQAAENRNAERYAAELKALAEKRLSWTGASMRRAGFKEEQIQRILTQGGTVVAWGSNKGSFGFDMNEGGIRFGAVGQSAVPPKLNGVVAIAAGDQHTLALKRDGTVVAWGGNADSQCNVPDGLSGVVAIAAGARHSMALKQDGTVAMWGMGYPGQNYPPTVLTGVVAIAESAGLSAALRQDGTVVAWPDKNIVPEGLHDVVAIAAGGGHIVGLKQGGNIVAWGNNEVGQCTVPTGLRDVAVVAIAAGYGRTVALKQNGMVEVWGDTSWDVRPVPAGLNGVIAIAAGGSHTVALKQDGTVVAWGVNFDGRCTAPVGLIGVVAIAAGEKHTVALKLDNDAEGTNKEAATLEQDSRTDKKRPAEKAVSEAQAIEAKRLTWTGAAMRRSGFKDNQIHSALIQGGRVVAWGDNGSGQSTVPAGLSGVVAIATAEFHSVALKRDGTVVAWGKVYGGSSGTHEPVSVPTGLSGVVAVAAGHDHIAALKQDGAVVAWGGNSGGQCIVPAGLNSVMAIAAGWHHTAVLKQDGTVVLWGEGYAGPYSPSDVGDVVAIAALGEQTLALKHDGTVVAIIKECIDY